MTSKESKILSTQNVVTWTNGEASGKRRRESKSPNNK